MERKFIEPTRKFDYSHIKTILDSSEASHEIKEGFRFLSDVGVKINNSNFFVITRAGDVVEKCSSKEFHTQLITEYGNQIVPDSSPQVTITKDLINAYVAGYTLKINTVLKFPCEQKVIYDLDGRVGLNRFVDESIIPSTTVLTPQEEELFSRFIHLICRGVFGIVEYDMDYKKFVDIVVNGDVKRKENPDDEPTCEELVQYFFSWVSYIYHNPGSRTGIAPALFGLAGTGKGTLTAIVSKIIGNSDSNQKQENTINHNAMMAGKLLVVFNECKDIKGFYNDFIKGTLTESEITINPKGVDQFKISNTLNSILISNHFTPFTIDTDDRRILVIQTMKDYDNYPKQIKDMFNDFFVDVNMPELEFLNTMAGIMAKIIVQIDYRHVNLHNINYYTTKARRNLMEAKLSPVERFFKDTSVKFFNLKDSQFPSSRRKTSIKKLELLFEKWTNTTDGLRNVSDTYSKNKDSFRKELKELALKGTYLQIVPRKKGNKTVDDYVFTEIFYENYVRDHEDDGIDIDHDDEADNATILQRLKNRK